MDWARSILGQDDALLSWVFRNDGGHRSFVRLDRQPVRLVIGAISAELPLSRRKSQPAWVRSVSALNGVPIVITCLMRGAICLPSSRA